MITSPICKFSLRYLSYANCLQMLYTCLPKGCNCSLNSSLALATGALNQLFPHSSILTGVPLVKRCSSFLIDTCKQVIQWFGYFKFIAFSIYALHLIKTTDCATEKMFTGLRYVGENILYWISSFILRMKLEI